MTRLTPNSEEEIRMTEIQKNPKIDPESNRIWREVGICQRCEGILLSKDSMDRGMGRTCWHKSHALDQYARLEREGQLAMFPKPEVANG